MPSPVYLAAAGTILAGAVGIAIGVARQPHPLPADVSTPVSLAPASAQPASTMDTAPPHSGSDDNVTTIPVRPHFNGPHSRSRDDNAGGDDHNGSSDHSGRDHGSKSGKR